jgi:NAD(P) transhydrogenase subunit alpha
MIGVPREIFPRRKAILTVPQVVEKTHQAGTSRSAIESGGDAANFIDDVYRAARATVIEGAAPLSTAADVYFSRLRSPSMKVALMREGGTLVSFIWPAQNPELKELAARHF